MRLRPVLAIVHAEQCLFDFGPEVCVGFSLGGCSIFFDGVDKLGAFFALFGDESLLFRKYLGLITRLLYENIC